MVFFGNPAVKSRIDEAVKIINKMGDGDFSTPIETLGSDVVAPLMLALKKNQEKLERRTSEGRRATDISAEQTALFDKLFSKLIGDVQAGKLSSRIKVDELAEKSLYRYTAEGVNTILDALFEPLSKIGSDLELIGKGDIPAKITDDFKGDFGPLKNNLNVVIDMLSGLMEEVRHMLSEHDKGDIDVVINVNRFQGAYKAMAQGVNDMVAGHIAVKKKAMACVKEFAEGNFDAPLEKFPGKKSFINDTIEHLRSNVKNFIGGMHRMSSEHDKGDIDAAIDVNRFQGVYKTMAQGVNDMVAGHIAVKKKAMACVKEFGEGNFDAPLEQFPGKKAFINDTIEKVRGNIKVFIDEMQHMSSEHDKGDIDVMINAGKFQGAYKIMAQGVNDMVAGHIAVKKKAMACVKEFGEGNFDAPLEKFPGKKAFINDTIEQVRANLQALISDSNMLSQAALEGRIHTRADASKHQGDFRKIVEGVNATLETIVAPIVVVKTAADSISTAAKEISAGNADLSHRTEQQAASLEETASSMEELASTVKQNADNAKQANQMAMTASDVAVKGGEVVQQVVNTMSAINESARKIVDIISVIDGIALQTNILALNAAVEAARAGEQGRGFAVVASEVRNLAQRSAAAAKEIKGLISDSVEKVEDGSKLVSEAGRTMDEIVVSVKRVTDIMSEITAASVEQSAGIDQVNQAITQMDEVTQQNAALVEEAAAAAESLEEQAATLAETVAQFRIDGAAGIPVAPLRGPSLSVVAGRKTATRPAAGEAKPRKAAIASAKPQMSNDDEWTEF
jgi:methyl-accepting chemotaxis protein